MHLNWLAKSICWGPGFPSVDIIGNKCCTRVLLYAKMLKKTENEETRLFSHIFSFGGILIGGTRVSWAPLLATPMIVKEDQKPRPGLARNQDFAIKGEDLNQMLKSENV